MIWSRNVAAGAALIASVFISAAVSAAEPGTEPPPPAERSPFGEKFYPAAAPAGRAPLMSSLDRANLAAPLDAARVNLYGHVQGSYTYNPEDPSQDLNLGRNFDVEANQFVLNQVDLNVERPVNLSGEAWDFGGRVEFLYGGDARFLHSNGMFDNQDFFDGPENQFDIPQLYADVNVPLGSGLRIRVGKFLFFKQIDPNASVFYSHSFTFGGALPYTHTGVTGYYKFNDQWSVEAGISRGWGQSLEDNNGSIDVLGRVRFSPSTKTSFALLFITGPEETGRNDNYRTAVDFVGSHQVSDRLTLMFDLVYGIQTDPSTSQLPLGSTGSDNADWYGAAGYAIYKIDDRFSVAGRLEWFRDDEGYFPVTAVAQDLLEATLGVTITPLPHNEIGRNLKVRPEIRWDWSSQDFFDGLTSDNQFTAAVDVIFNF